MDNVVRVYNLFTGDKQYYTCDPESAVIAAYAQSFNDYNTWDYKEKYSYLVGKTEHCIFCGDFGTVISKESSGSPIEIEPDNEINLLS